MSNAYLIYRPVMDYEESETAYLVCLTKERADAVRAEMVAFAENLLESFDSLFDDEGEALADEKWNAAAQANEAKVKQAKWPYGISLDDDLQMRFNFYKGRDCFDVSCIAIRELPLV